MKAWQILPIGLLFLSVIRQAAGSPGQDPLAPASFSLLEAGTYKGIDVDRWNGWYRFSSREIGGWRPLLEDRLTVTLHRAPGFKPQWKVDQSLDMRLDRSISPVSNLMLVGSHREFRDQPTEPYADITMTNPSQPPRSIKMASLDVVPVRGFAEKIRKVTFGLGGSLVSGSRFEMGGSVGPVFDQQGGIEQNGIRYDAGFGFEADSIAWNGEGWLERFGTGDYHNLKLGMDGGYMFGEGAHNQLQCAYTTGKRREISPFDAAVSHREDTRFSLENRLDFLTGNELNITWLSNLNNRTAISSRESGSQRDHEMIWNNDLVTDLSLWSVNLIARGGLDLQQQEYGGSLTQGRNTRLQLTAAILASPEDSLVADAAGVRYRFDTPDALDHNDRDELRWKFRIIYRRAVSSDFALKAGLETDLNHLVYLHSSRSGENRWTRLFSLYGETPWNYRWLQNRARFSVAAHYTAYDYSPFDVTQSRVFRSYIATDTLRLHFTRGWGLELSGSKELDDHGGFNWSRWVENVAEEGESETMAILPFRRNVNYDISFGWMFFNRKSVLKHGSAPGTIATEIHSDGPQARLQWQVFPSLTTEFSGAILHTRRKDMPDESIPDLNLQIEWSF
jgi:hypothetical protein